MSFFQRLLGRQPSYDHRRESIVAACIQSIERNPGQETHYLHLLNSCEKAGELDAAIACLTKLVARNRHIDMPYRYLLVAHAKKGDFNNLTELVKHHYQNEKAHQWFLVHAYDTRDWDSAIALLRQLVELFPRDEKWPRYLVAACGKKREVVAGASERTSLTNDMHSEDVGAAGKNSEPEVPASKPSIPADARLTPQESTPQRDIEFETNLKLKQKQAEIDAEERERKKYGPLRRPRALTPRQKFNSIKPTGSRDGYS